MKALLRLTSSAENSRDIHDMNRFLQRAAKDSPAFVIALALCPLIGGTDTAAHGLLLGLTALAALFPSELFGLALAPRLPAFAQTAVRLFIVALFVSLAQRGLAWLSPALLPEIEPSVALVIVSCMILSQRDKSAATHWSASILDGILFGAVFAAAATAFGAFRELLGTGGVWGGNLLGADFEPWTVFSQPAGGLFVLGGALLIFDVLLRRSQARAAGKALAARGKA